MKSQICCILIIFLLSLSSTGSAHQTQHAQIEADNRNTLFVGGSGPNNYTTIQSAIYAASEGDTIFVFDESSPYYENIIIDKSINLKGEHKKTTIIDGQGNGDTILCRANNTHIQGFTIQNGYKPGGYWWIAGIQLTICNFCIINNNIITGNYYGLRLYGSENCMITNNTIQLNEITGIWVHNQCYNSAITNNIIENNDCAGIKIEDTQYCIVDKNIIINNPFDGIQLDCVAHTKISNNDIFENGYNAISMRSSYENTVINNELKTNGLLISQVHLINNTVDNNFVDGKPLVYLTDESDQIIANAGQVILLRCDRITVKDLLISHVFYGIQTYSCDDCTITNNILKENYAAIYIGYDYPEVFHNLQITQNEITNNQNGIILNYCIEAEISENEIKNNANTALRISGKNHNICYNTIESNSEGIYAKGLQHTIHHNILKKNKIGIYADRLESSILSKNLITTNNHGIYLESSTKNIISKNNIYKNYITEAFFKDSLNNIWRRNYWNKLFGPKIIFGLKYYYPSIWGPPTIIPVLCIDLNPKKTPYPITSIEEI